MSDAERLDLRDLPPAEPVKVPSRFSQTFLRYADNCKRAAYLYLRDHGGAPAHPLDFGTAVHSGLERGLLHMIEHDEPRIDEDTSKLIAREVVRDHPELTLTLKERDALRECMWHFSVGMLLDPSKIVAVERKFGLELGGWQLVGKVDVALLAEQVGEVLDWKSTWAIPAADEWEGSFQTFFYGVLLCFGYPLETVAGEEVPGLPIGDRIEFVRCTQAYPRFLTKRARARLDVGEMPRPEDGGIVTRSVVLSRAQLQDVRDDLADVVADMAGRFESWKFPAVRGKHCSECPCPADCPLPEKLRDHAGTITTLEEAAEAAEKLEWEKADHKARREEIKRFATAHGPIPFGTDQVWDFTQSERRSVDVDGLVDAAERAAAFGEPFSVGEFVTYSPSSRFDVRTLKPAEMNEPEPEEDGRGSLDEEFGVDAPF